MEYVLCVDKHNNEIGTMEKILAHQGSGILHRAFSVILTNNQGEILLQQRSLEKYHCPGLRANACCSHPRIGELTIDAANRRTREELGIKCNLNEGESFIYHADCGNNLVEYEYDTIYTGVIEQKNIAFNTAEVLNIKRITVQNLKSSLSKNPKLYTPRFHEIANILRK